MIYLWIVFLYILPTGFSYNIPKCCPKSFAFSQFGQCFDFNDTIILPEQFNTSHNAISIIPNSRPSCKSYLLKPDQNYTVDTIGQIHLFYGEVIEIHRYCIEYIVGDQFNIVLPLICFKNDEDDLGFTLYSCGYIVSSVFIVTTLLIYTFLPQLRTLHVKLNLIYLLNLLLAFVSTAVVQTATIVDDLLCKVLSFSVQYFFLATFFWLNVMCIDIYWAFSCVRSRGSRAGSDRRKLILYSLYAWGMPLVILLITVTVDFTDFVPDSSPFKPKVGTNKCFFDDRTSAYMYFYGPMAVLLFANMVLFGITAYRIWRTSKETAALNRGDSRRHADRQENERFRLYVKLFLVMGINWMAELVSFIFGEQVPHYLWYVTDLTNTLQGVFIFVIFVWKRRVRLIIKTAMQNNMSIRSISSSGSRRTMSTKL